MTIKGFLDGAFLAGLSLLWLDVWTNIEPSFFTLSLVTVPVVWRMVIAAGGPRGERA